MEFVALVFERSREAGEHALGNQSRLFITRVFAQDRELVAPDARDGVFDPRGFREASGGLDEYRVAGLVAHLIVDQLEAIDVDEQHRKLVRMPL